MQYRKKPMLKRMQNGVARNIIRLYSQMAIQRNNCLHEADICCLNHLKNGVNHKRNEQIYFLPNIPAYSLTHSLRMIFSRKFTKDQARLQLARWYDKVDNSGFVSFNTIAGTIYEHYDEILNYFVNRSTNAFAESFNAKIKAFRAQLRGVTDLKFFLYRLTKLFA